MGRAKKSAVWKTECSNPYSAFAEKGAQAFRSIHVTTETASGTTEVNKTNPSKRRSKRIKKFDDFVKQQELRKKKEERLWKEDPILLRQRLRRQLLDKKITKRLLKFAARYRPETRAMKKKRQELKKNSAGFQEVESDNGDEDSSDDEGNCSAEGSNYYEDTTHNKVGEDHEDKNDKSDKTGATGEEDTSGKVYVLKFGLNHIAALIQEKKAKLVLIAGDASPPETAEWISSLCRKGGIPYCLLDGKTRLGNLVHKRQVPVIAFSEVRPSDKTEFDALLKEIKDHNAELKESTKDKEFMYTGLPGFRAQLMNSLIGGPFQSLNHFY
ncbi:60S ribosomal protein L8B [Mortierella sp. AD011]|nr:60S ribosomal protein L8B [Mortierella sp. AD010]KAF9401670.1 60S ribosomal protein L8B [Mortierella sp. AD011]